MNLRKILVACAALTLCEPAVDAEDLYRRAVMSYQAHHYSAALADLEKLVVQYPNNAMVRYYRALAYQGTNQMSLARKDFEWVATNCPDGKIKQLGAAGLRNLGGYSSASTSSNSLMNNGVPKFFAQAAPASNNSTSGMSSGMQPGQPGMSSNSSGSSSSTSASSGGADGSRPFGKLQKILEFTSETCRPCIAFAPIFAQTKSRYPALDMQSLDVADAGNAALVAQYNVKNYPTLVFLSNSGNVLLKRAGAPVSVAQFSQLIDQYR